MAGPVQFALEQTEILDAQAAAKALQSRKADPKGKLKKLEDEATRRGYKKAAGPQAEFGMRQKFKANKPVRPPAGEQGAPVQELNFELSVSALESPNSDDQAAIATVTVTAGQNTEQYDMLLEAVGGDFDDVRELKVEND